ncbi:MAG: alpha/beta fold hydrolase [Methylococcaceae bacterium]|nr:alpha/beta fold hydrolase [Methylococcaceae bacterium]MDP3904368.1 alpha/beta fold hydrolase [Methylococcaceae bacterium]
MTKIHQETYGSGKPIVLVHGWAMHTGIWRNFAKQLAQNYRVTCIDLPGHGQSEALQPFNLEQISELLANNVDIESACWLGWSLGATVVLDFARRFPERCSALILMTGNPHFTQVKIPSKITSQSRNVTQQAVRAELVEACTACHSELEFLRSSFDTLRTNEKNVLVEENSVLSISDKTSQWPGMKIELLDSFADSLQENCQATLLRFLSLQVNGLQDYKKLIKELKTAVAEYSAPDEVTLQGGLEILKTADLRAVMGALTMPMLSILGAKDALVPVAVGEYLQTLSPNMTVKVIDKAGHAPFLSHPNEVTELMSDFIERHV